MKSLVCCLNFLSVYLRGKYFAGYFVLLMVFFESELLGLFTRFPDGFFEGETLCLMLGFKDGLLNGVEIGFKLGRLLS